MDLLLFRELVELSWADDTTYTPDCYSGEDPSYGQCAVTALLVQDFFLGDLVAGYVRTPSGERIRHYWNRVGDIDIDLTWRQFPHPSRVVEHEVVERRKVLESPSTRRRYDILRDRFHFQWQRMGSTRA